MEQIIVIVKKVCQRCGKEELLSHPPSGYFGEDVPLSEGAHSSHRLGYIHAPCVRCGESESTYLTIQATTEHGAPLWHWHTQSRREASPINEPTSLPQPRHKRRSTKTHLLASRYQIQGGLGHGMMSDVHWGIDTQTSQPVAIKVLRDIYSLNGQFVIRFRHSARKMLSLQHPNIVQVYDYGESDGKYFMVMELVKGHNLHPYMRVLGRSVGRAVGIAHEIALGLGAAHSRNIVHRNLKPQNILVDNNGSVKVTAFSLPHELKLGTVYYSAPEQALRDNIKSPAADVYALGIIMYEMLTGHRPFDGETPVAVAIKHVQEAPVPPSHINPTIPPEVEAIILRCLEKEPERRYPDGTSLARALESLDEV